jgi:hypothetical protein
MDKQFVVYGHYGDDGQCFYVGLGNKKRPFRFKNRSAFWNNYVLKYCRSGKPVVKIWHSGLTLPQAIEHEKFWVSIYGRRNNKTGCLVNLTDGGEGVIGMVVSEARRAQVSAQMKGNKHCLGKSPPNKGVSPSKETREKIAAKLRGIPLSEEHKLKLKETNNPPSRKGSTITEEHKQKISQTHKGRKNSPETLQKMSEARKKYYSNLKAEKAYKTALENYKNKGELS